MTDSKRLWLLWTSIILLILFISALIYAIFLYIDLNSKRTAGFEDTTREILNQTDIAEVTEVERFNGAESYHVINGTNADSKEKIIFYPLKGNEKTLTTIDAEEIIPKDSIIGHFRSTYPDRSLIDVTPALVDDEA